MVQLATTASGGTLGDLFLALVSMLRSEGLGATQANFIKELTVLTFTFHRKAYETVLWKSIVECFTDALTAPQAYMLLLAPARPTTSSGASAELQLHTPESFSAKQTAHGLYEQWRVLPADSPAKQALAKQKIENAQKVRIPHEIEKIK